jgi:hypothetical protein
MQYNTLNWINKLQSFIKCYNSIIHRSLEYPMDITVTACKKVIQAEVSVCNK